MNGWSVSSITLHTCRISFFSTQFFSCWRNEDLILLRPRGFFVCLPVCFAHACIHAEQQNDHSSVSAVAAFLTLETHVLLFCSVFSDIVLFCVSKINWWWWWWSENFDRKNLHVCKFLYRPTISLRHYFGKLTAAAGSSTLHQKNIWQRVIVSKVL